MPVVQPTPAGRLWRWREAARPRPAPQPGLAGLRALGGQGRGGARAAPYPGRGGPVPGRCGAGLDRGGTGAGALAFVDAEIAADPGAAGRLQAILAAAAAKENTMLCRECGEPMFIEENGVSHHEGGSLDGIDYDRDADHVAVAEVEPGT